MAVFTQIDRPLLEAFLADYALAALTGFKGIQAGVQNSNFIVETQDAKYILTIYEDTATGVNPDDLPYFLQLMQHLASKGINCPTPIMRADGALIGSLAGKPAALVSFLEGRGTITPKPQHCKNAGAALAAMHLAGQGFSLTRANDQGPDKWQALFSASSARADAVTPGLGDLMQGELAHLAAQWPSDLPSGVIHADLFPDNVFFINREVTGLIDFYFACHDIWAYDLAIMLNAWCFEADVNFNITKARALLSGYQSVRPMSAAEIDALPILARGAAMRFLTTRLHDWLNQPEEALLVPKNPVDYLRRLRFHRHVKSAADYGLEL
jgi:homoserine kinase type II